MNHVVTLYILRFKIKMWISKHGFEADQRNGARRVTALIHMSKGNSAYNKKPDTALQGTI